MNLIEFLRARLGEDERVAGHGPETWQCNLDDEGGRPGALLIARGHYIAWDLPEQMAIHLARHDPARALAEADAKRKIIEVHARRKERRTITRLGHPTETVDLWVCTTCCDDRCPTWEAGGQGHRDLGLIECCETLPLLALPYAGHPDYDPAWRPA